MDRVASEPLSLLWLSWEDAATPCPQRLVEASRLLTTHADRLHISSRKLVVASREELEYCVSSGGACCMNLYGPFRLLANMWVCHVADLEDVNGMIKAILAMGPSSGLALVDALVGNRKDCGLGSRDTKVSKYSQVKHKLESINDEAAAHYIDAANVTSQLLRFATLPPAAPLPVRNVTAIAPKLSGSSVPFGSLAWAAGYSRRWMRSVEQALKDRANDQNCTRFIDLLGTPAVWICTHLYRHYCSFAKCMVDEHGMCKGLADPYECSSSMVIFAKWHQRCSELHDDKSVSIELLSLARDSDNLAIRARRVWHCVLDRASAVNRKALF